ncbi:MAG TPA: Fe-S cluster assembly protein SufD [Steroidobacteraceae bacterium]|nr:Fe-S cluster assembly protein SufD [Steroidobacteraceae bacterium]
MSSPLTARIVEQHASTVRTLAARLPGAARRRAAMETLAVTGLPGPREENWKYANLRPLERASFTPAALTPPAAAAGAAVAADLPARLAGFARYVFVDGVFAPALSDALGATVARLTPLAARADGPDVLPQSPGPRRELAADQRFALLNEAFATDGAAIDVPAGLEAARLELIFVASAEAQLGASYPRVELRLEARGRLVLVERHVSAGPGASFVTSAVSAELARGATLAHYRLQELGSRAILFDTLGATLAQDASYRLHALASGAAAARSTLGVRLIGERAGLALSVAALGDRQQVQDTYALVEHLAPHARTEETFRGISAGRARVAFNGKIVVARDAHGTDSRQSLRGLLAGPEAEIDVRPQLEIYTDDVRCSHGATAGKLDDNMLFYLLSRGLDRDSAQRALKWAFLEDVIAKIEVPDLRRQIEERFAGAMQDGAALRELI